MYKFQLSAAVLNLWIIISQLCFLTEMHVVWIIIPDIPDLAFPQFCLKTIKYLMIISYSTRAAVIQFLTLLIWIIGDY